MMFKESPEGQTNYCQSCEDLQRQLEEKTRLLAAYEAQPVVGYGVTDAAGFTSLFTYKEEADEYNYSVFDGFRFPNSLIAKFSSTSHLDALLAEAERRGMERAAEMARKSGATNLASKIDDAAEVIRAAAQNL